MKLNKKLYCTSKRFMQTIFENRGKNWLSVYSEPKRIIFYIHKFELRKTRRKYEKNRFYQQQIKKY